MIDYNEWLKHAPKKLNAGLTIIKKIKNKPDYIILLGGNYTGETKKYEMLGGRYEHTDKTALHTGIREFTEELFNIKLDLTKLDKLVEQIIINTHLIDDLTHKSDTSVSYYAGFKTLELIYNYVYNNQYKIVQPLDFAQFMEKRNWKQNQQIQSNGLYEIQFISVVYLSKAHMLPLRKFSYNQLTILKSKLGVI